MRKNTEAKNNKQYLRYPDREEMRIIVGGGDAPFQNAVVGITYPFPDYSITRTEASKTTVFEYVLEGEGDIFVGERHLHVTAGQMYILRANEAHTYRASSSSPWKKLWINYTAEYVSPYLDALGIETSSFDCPQAKKYFEEAIRMIDSDGARREICRHIADTVHSVIDLAHTATRGVREVSDGFRIREELDASLYSKLSLDELASRLHISKSNIIRIFKKNYGVTPYEYLLGEKLETAKLLLLNTRLSVTEIAERLAISDAHYFSTLFSKRVGMRPLANRRHPK